MQTSLQCKVLTSSSTTQPTESDDFLFVSDGGVADWIYLLRGTREIISMNHEALEASEFGPMFSAGGRRYVLRLVDTSPHAPLSELLAYLGSVVKDKDRLDIYSFAIEEMRKTFSVVNSTSYADLQVTDVSIWIFTATDEYLALLKARDNAALVILGFFCVLLRRLESHVRILFLFRCLPDELLSSKAMSCCLQHVSCFVSFLYLNRTLTGHTVVDGRPKQPYLGKYMAIGR